MTPTASGGIIDKPSNHPAQDTLKNLEATPQAKGVKLFSVTDHSGEAEKANLETRPTKLLIFGKPKAGTPVMLAATPATKAARQRFNAWLIHPPRSMLASGGRMATNGATLLQNCDVCVSKRLSCARHR